MRHTKLSTLFLAALLAACSASSGEIPDASTDVRDTRTPDISADTPTDGSGDDGGDDVEPDPVVDVEPDPDVVPDLPEPDAVPDFPFDCEVIGEECDSSAIYCVEGENEVGFCSRCGEILRTESCDVLEVCEVIDGAGRCRPCDGEECPVLDACDAGERTCLDHNTVQVCGPDGRVDSVADCAAGRRCFRGACGNAGANTGEACEQNIDDSVGCNGHTCICGSDFAPPGDAGALCEHAAFASGYCSTADCEANGCDYRDETCANFELSGAFGGGQYCLLTEDCSVRRRSCGTGFECTEFPGRRRATGPIEWNWGCWLPDLNTIGDACTTHIDCIGGDCRQATVAGGSASYCTSACGESGTCPSHAACVEDPDGDDYVCLANASSADCPRLDTEPLNIDPTPPLNRYGVGSTSVCYFAR
jgi:hypothetical protein